MAESKVPKLEPKLESIEKMEDSLAEEKITKPEGYLFNLVEAQRWLDFSYARVQKAFDSIVFDIEEMPEENLGLLLSLVSNAIKGEIVNAMGAVVGKGVLYIPEKLAKRQELKWLVRGGKVGKFIAFHR